MIGNTFPGKFKFASRVSEHALVLFEKIVARLADLGLKYDGTRFVIHTNERDFWKRLASLVNSPSASQGSAFFASGLSDIDIGRIDPVLEPVESPHKRMLFRHALSFWSVPVSRGYGRRMEFLIWDRGNGKVMGILGLCDPLIGLGVRDRYIGWNKETKSRMLWHCMTAYVLGAVPPYNALRGAKLVALAAASREVREHFARRYAGRTGTVSGLKRRPYLVLVDTMAAFGKSAIYNRLKRWRFVGYTEGKTTLHLTANGAYEMIARFMREHMPEVWKRNRFGDGPNWRIRVLREFFKLLGFSSRQFENLLCLGTRRAYYVCPHASNWREFLRGEDPEPQFFERNFASLVQEWRERWMKVPAGCAYAVD